MNATQIRDKVDQLLEQWKIDYGIFAAGTAHKWGTEMDAWRFKFKQQFRKDPSKPYLEMADDFFTGIGLRKLSPMDERELKKWPYGTSMHARIKARAKPVAPRAADVLHNLVVSLEATEMSFAEWCANYSDGNTDSIKSLNTYLACQKEAEELRKMFTRDQLNELIEVVQEL